MKDKITKFKEPKKLEKLKDIEIINGEYLELIRGNFDLELVPIKKASLDNFRVIRLKRIVYKKKKEKIEEFLNFLTALFHSKPTFGTLIISNDEKTVDFYILIKDTETEIINKYRTLKNSLKGNFPGSDFEEIEKEKIGKILSSDTLTKKSQVITSITGIPSTKKQNEVFIQNIDRFIDAMEGKPFALMVIAKPVDNEITNQSMKALLDLATLLSAEEKISLTLSESKTETHTHSEGTSHFSTFQKTKAKTEGYALSVFAGVFAFFGAGAGYSHSWSTTTSTTSATSDGTIEMDSISQAKTEGESISITVKNHQITHKIRKIQRYVKRMEEGQRYGFWNTGVFIFTNNEPDAYLASSTIQALIAGENSELEPTRKFVWKQEDNEEFFNNLRDTILNLEFPAFSLKKYLHPEFLEHSKIEFITPTSLLNSKELALLTGFPENPTTGLDVVDIARFGKKVPKTESPSIEIATIAYMGQKMKKGQRIKLNLNDLTMHTFICGTTGSGKSNTLFNIVEQIKSKIPFLVIEPTKGEYKNILGGYEDINVYGTNPYYSPLLKLNPFQFPEGVHVLEHIDRLIEIFNAAWPMYAAMPAILKDLIVDAYKHTGWNLTTSQNKFNLPVYPTFELIFNMLPLKIETYGYSEEVKSNYIGALSARLKSLITGLTGHIFVSNPLNESKLFNSNTIIDLSRIGSTETKALIMGMILMKLIEQRITEGQHKGLKHLTILEEAHLLLRKTSFEQNNEIANLKGKSVEMLANAIAEMRSFGEGFIIADQSPELLDSNTIKNTNTKIILKLPDKIDREIAGTSAMLNKEQIDEIGRLKTGMAVIYQNNWIEPVLCQIDKFPEKKIKKLEYDKKVFLKHFEENKKMKKKLIQFLFRGKIYEPKDILKKQTEKDIEEANKLKEWLLKEENEIPLHLKEKIKNYINQFLNKETPSIWKKENSGELSEIVASLFQIEGSAIKTLLKEGENLKNEEIKKQMLLDLKARENLGLDDIYHNLIVECQLNFLVEKGNNIEKNYFGFTMIE